MSSLNRSELMENIDTPATTPTPYVVVTCVTYPHCDMIMLQSHKCNAQIPARIPHSDPKLNPLNTFLQMSITNGMGHLQLQSQ